MFAHFFLDLLSFSNVAENNDTASGLAVFIPDWRAAVFYRNTFPILFPKDIIFDKTGLTIMIGRVNGAFIRWVKAAVLAGVMEDFMLAFTD
jgi:hypothetical protein